MWETQTSWTAALNSALDEKTRDHLSLKATNSKISLINWPNEFKKHCILNINHFNNFFYALNSAWPTSSGSHKVFLLEEAEI